MEISSGQGVVQIKPYSVWSIPYVYLEYKPKTIFATACVGKKLVFHTEFCELHD